jgi:histone H3/H4
MIQLIIERLIYEIAIRSYMPTYTRRVINAAEVRRFIDRANPELRVSDGYVNDLNRKVEELISRHMEACLDDKRTTIQGRDV